MNDQNGIEELITKTKEYIQLRIKLGKLSLIEKGAFLFAGLVTDGVVLIFLILAFLFGSLGLGFYLSYLLNDTFSGFFIIAGTYLLLGILIYFIKDKYLEKPIVNSVIKKVFKNDEEDQREH